MPDQFDALMHRKAKKIERDEDLVRVHESGAAKALTLELELLPPAERRAIYDIVHADDKRNHKTQVIKDVDNHLLLTSPYSVGPVDPVKEIGDQIKKGLKHLLGGDPKNI